MTGQPRRMPRVVAWLVIAGVAVAALCVGGIGGAIIGGNTGEAGAEPAGGVPELPAAFPDHSQRYLPDVTVGGVESWLTDDKGFTCEPELEVDPASGATQQLTCDAPEDHSFARVYVEYDDDASVRQLSAPCRRSAQTPADYCLELYSVAAGTGFVDQPELQEEAGAWAAENAERDALTVLGGIELSTDLHLGQLRLRPAA